MLFNKKTTTKEMEETILSDTKQMKGLYERIEELENIIGNKDIEIKNLNEDIILLQNKNKILNDIIEKNTNKSIKNLESEVNDLYVNNSSEVLIDKNVCNKFTKYYSFEEICNIPLPPITDDEEILLNVEKNIESVKVLYENQNNLDVFLNNYGLKNQDDLIEVLERSKNNNVPMNDTGKKTSKNRDKTLSILERYPVKIYKIKHIKNNEILSFMASENKVLIRFQSMIAEKINDDTIWEDIYNFKIEYGELKNTRSEKKRFKYKITRCKILYDKYSENLSNFQIYLSHISDMSENDWKMWLLDFDKLYNDVYKNDVICKHKYKDDKICGKIDCKVKHKEIR